MKLWRDCNRLTLWWHPHAHMVHDTLTSNILTVDHNTPWMIVYFISYVCCYCYCFDVRKWTEWNININCYAGEWWYVTNERRSSNRWLQATMLHQREHARTHTDMLGVTNAHDRVPRRSLRHKWSVDRYRYIIYTYVYCFRWRFQSHDHEFLTLCSFLCVSNIGRIATLLLFVWFCFNDVFNLLFRRRLCMMLGDIVNLDIVLVRRSKIVMSKLNRSSR